MLENLYFIDFNNRWNTVEGYELKLPFMVEIVVDNNNKTLQEFSHFSDWDNPLYIDRGELLNFNSKASLIEEYQYLVEKYIKLGYAKVYVEEFQTIHNLYVNKN